LKLLIVAAPIIPFLPALGKDVSGKLPPNDSTIDPGYYSVAELENIYYRSQKNGCQCTLVLEDAGRCIRGVRIT